MCILNKSTIEKWILLHLTIGERGFETTAPLAEVVKAIFYRHKTGCQWRELPTKQFFNNKVLSWQSVFYYFNKWWPPLRSKNGCWQKIWVDILSSYRQYLDFSSAESGGVPLDGSHTPAKNGDDAIGYQGRKECNTTNSLFKSDNQGGCTCNVNPTSGTTSQRRTVMICLK